MIKNEPKSIKNPGIYEDNHQLESHAASPLGKSLCRELSPSSDLEEIRTRQAQTTDAVNRVRLKGSVSFSGLREIGGSLKRLEIGSSLNIMELLAVSSVLTVAARAKSYGRREESELPDDSLDEMFRLLELSPPSIRRSSAVFSPRMR